MNSNSRMKTQGDINLSEDFHDVAKCAHTFIDVCICLQHPCVMLSLQPIKIQRSAE